MSRTTRGVTTRKKHKRILLKTKGYKGRRKSTIRIAQQALIRAMSNRSTSIHLKRRYRKLYTIDRTNRLLNNHQFNYKTISHALCQLKLGLGSFASLCVMHESCGSASILPLTSNV
ncbi:MAG: 50S ribosomal protein L20 [Candidatus Hodgkinia cicadicola]